MRTVFKKKFIAVSWLLLVLPASVWAQGSSINTFSPYTFHGLGDFAAQGPAWIRSIGGTGIAYRSGMMVNYLNPAGLSAMGRNTFIFDVGLEGQNFYSRTAETRTSYNSMNINNVALQFSVYRKMGIGVSVTPLTNVGYRVDMFETDPEILAELGQVRYFFNGSGGITQAKIGYGVELFKGFSLGANMIYYLGNINRVFGTEIIPITAEGSFGNVNGSHIEDYSRIGGDVGLQYNLVAKQNRVLTFGATFQPRTNLRPRRSSLVTTSSLLGDTAAYSTGRADIFLPATFTAGLFYQTPKIGLGMDYTWQDWRNLNKGEENSGITFRSSQYVKAGLQYTPNRYDVRHFYNRWTYRAGFRYNDYYMVVNDNRIQDFAVTFGLGIPFRALSQGYSSLNIGVELGARGSTRTGEFNGRQFQMIRENYFKFVVGFSLFGEDYWFVKHKYN